MNLITLAGATSMSVVCRYQTAQAAGAAAAPINRAAFQFGHGGSVNVQVVEEAQAAVLLQKAQNSSGGTKAAMISESCVIRLMNMVAEEDLGDPEMHAELVEEITEECEKYGELARVHVPTRASGHMSIEAQTEAGVGMVFLAYKTIAGAQAALKATVGRKFGGQQIEGGFYSDEAFARELYSEKAQEKHTAAAAAAAAKEEKEDRERQERKREQEQEEEQEEQEQEQQEEQQQEEQQQEEEEEEEDALDFVGMFGGLQPLPGFGMEGGLTLAPPPPPVSLPYQATEEDEEEDEYQ
jgi:hypothetical protein